MPRRYLFGPVTPDFADQNLRGPRRSGACLTFNAGGGADLTIRPDDSWEAIVARFLPGWRPDLIALDLHYTTVPAALLTAPVPRVGLAADWPLLWHHYRRRLRHCQLALTDTAGVVALARGGIAQDRAANLFGCERRFLEAASPPAPRDIDILFIGSLHPAIQEERLAWLARLARLGERWRVVIQTNVYGEAYGRLLWRARIVFNRCIRKQARRTLARLDEPSALDPSALDSGHFPPVFDHFRVEWERAA